MLSQDTQEVLGDDSIDFVDLTERGFNTSEELLMVVQRISTRKVPLVYLKLDANNITDELAFNLRNIQVRHLSLQVNEITNRGAIFLNQECPTVTNLNLGFNFVDDEGAKILMTITEKRITLASNRVNPNVLIEFNRKVNSIHVK